MWCFGTASLVRDHPSLGTAWQIVLSARRRTRPRDRSDMSLIFLRISQTRGARTGRPRPRWAPSFVSRALSGRVPASPTPSFRSKRLIEIGDQVLDILDPARQPNQRVVDPERRALVGWNRGMRHQSRVIDETFDAAQALGDREDAQLLEKAARLIHAALHEQRHDAEIGRASCRERAAISGAAGAG